MNGQAAIPPIEQIGLDEVPTCCGQPMQHVIDTDAASYFGCDVCHDIAKRVLGTLLSRRVTWDDVGQLQAAWTRGEMR